MEDFRCWAPECGECVMSGGTIKALDPGNAAELYAETFWNDDPKQFPYTVKVAVRGFGDILVTVFGVEPRIQTRLAC